MSHWSRLSLSSVALLCLICALGASLTVAQSSGDTPCSPPSGSQSTCLCQTDDGVIDLTPLDLAKKDGKPKFTGLKDEGGVDYEYNPCSTFSEGSGKPCQNVFLCQSQAGKPIYTAANDNEKIFKDSSGKYYIHYTGPGDRDTKVYLHCDQSNRDGSIKSNSVDQSVKSHYVLQLDSCHACPGGCAAAPGPTHTGPAPGYIGIVLIIVIFFSLIAYFIIGALLLKFHFQASGTDVIPNKTFWVQFPLLVKDGCVFTFGPCINFIAEKVKRRNDYQKI